MQLKKIIVVIVAAISCLISITQVASATVVKSYSIVSPLYEIAHDACSDLRLSGSNATCKSNASSGSAVKITAEQYLQKQGLFWIWSTYNGAEWSKTVNTNTIIISNTKSGLESGTYRLKTVFTLTDSNGKTETITVYSNEKTVG